MKSSIRARIFEARAHAESLRRQRQERRRKREDRRQVRLVWKQSKSFQRLLAKHRAVVQFESDCECYFTERDIWLTYLADLKPRWRRHLTRFIYA